MKKPLPVCILVFLLLLSPLGAQVNQDELGGLGPVDFINYEGPYSRIDTRAQIRDIGHGLGLAVSGGAQRPGATNRYFVISSRSEADGSRLDADIFGLGSDAMVDHIRNLRLIVQGYLEGAYNYSESDAALLSHYITVYNAVHRGALEFLDTRYRGPVMTHLTRERAGLSIRFDEWPGQTLMLIPIGTGLGGPLSAIDTGSLVSPEVREQLRQEPDASIDVRRDMVDLLEREADQALEIAAAAREDARQEEERIAAERERARQQEEEARRQQEEAQRQQQEIARQRQQEDSDQADLARREEEARRQEEEARRQQEEARRQQEELDERQEAVEELRAEAERQEEFAEQRIEEAQEERQQIAIDQQTIIEEQASAVQPSRIEERESVLGFAILNTGSALGRLVRIDINTGREVARSPLNTVNARTVTRMNNRIFAIAGENRGSGAIRLVEINPQTLEMQSQGDDDIDEGSLLWLEGQDLYALVRLEGNLYLGRFNTSLALEARSTVTVHPFASLLFSDNRIAVQRANGSVLLLNRSDLREEGN